MGSAFTRGSGQVTESPGPRVLGRRVTAGSLHTAPGEPVLIVGAGPAGLTAALELSRMGIAVRIVDNLPVRSATPQAVVMRSQTLALLERRGVNPEMLRDANQVAVGGVYGNGTLLGKVPLTRTQSRPHFTLLVRQAEAERVLRDQLARQGSWWSAVPR